MKDHLRHGHERWWRARDLEGRVIGPNEGNAPHTVFGLWLMYSRMHITQNLAQIQPNSCQLTLFTTGKLALGGVCLHTTSGYFM